MKHYFYAELRNESERCPSCKQQLGSVMLRNAKPQDLPKPEFFHVGGERLVKREPLGVMVVGDCPRCGFVKSYPMGQAVEA